MENEIKWYHKKWVRVIAAILAVIMIFTTVGYVILRNEAVELYKNLADSDEYLKRKSNDFATSFDLNNMILNMSQYSDLKKLMKDGDYDQAIEKVKSLIASETDSARLEQLHELLCELDYNVGNYEEAAKEADICIDSLDSADTAFLFYYLGAISYMHTGEYATSVKYIDNILEIGDDPQLFYYRGINNMALQEFEQASLDFKKSIELGKADTDLFYDLGICLISNGEMDEGIEKLDYVIETDDVPELTSAAQNILVAISQEE